DGQTEWINQEVENFLQKYVSYKQTDWASWLTAAEFHYNDKQHSAMHYSPFYLNYGRHPWKGIIMALSPAPVMEDFITDLTKA
ncbi:hypothetical protein AN958_09053, partial [Leucoagaricus sp. SymC.cos]